MAIILATSGVVLFITAFAFVAQEFVLFRRSAVEQLSTLGQIVATNSTAALAFDNQNDATEILGALRAEPHVEKACLYTADGRVFAVYPAQEPVGQFPSAPGSDGYRFVGDRLIGFAPVAEIKGRRLGTLYLDSNLNAMRERLWLYGEIVLFVVLVSAVVAYLLSRKLQHQISRPILALAETARAVSDRRDYGVRAEKQSEDELGLLTDAFNHMLGQIQEQNLALQKAYDDLRRTQQAITQQERLGALGQMASGVAHDINNAISPASLYLESLLTKEPNLSARAREQLTIIQRSVDDVAETVSRLREFYRPREAQLVLAPVDLNDLVDHVIDLTRIRWRDLAERRGIVIEAKIEKTEPLPSVLGLEGELRDALTNLIFNAVDAMPSGGVITVRTRSPHPTADGAPGVAVEVSDTGIGMDEETKRRCLEPFFTTKGERGTGLGLAMVYGTVRRHRAQIEIDSAVGRGTTVRLVFPAPASDLEKESAAPMEAAAQNPLRLLVVDDDAALLESLTQTLRDEGHDVTAASGGRQAIDLFLEKQKIGAPFAVVITDLGMPKVDGREVARAVKNASPATPVFLLTGWGARLETEGDVPPGVDRVLTKPPKLRDLRAALATVLPK